MNSLSIHRGFRIAILVSIVTAFAASQTITTAELAGAVADASGAAVVGATVVLKSMDTGETRAATSNGSGLYRFPFVKPGSYELSGTSVGLKSDTHRLSAAVGQALVVDLRLKPEQTKEVVVVTDAAPLLDLDNANLTYTLSQRQLELLPLPGEDMIAVTYSMPAVVINNNRYGAGNFASQGIGSLSNVFTVDGADVMDPYSNANSSGTTGLLLGANEIQEASVIQNAYDGHYGRQAGAQVNYVTKSGTNSYHGNLLYNYNGTLLNANDFFSNSTGVPRYHAASDQYAASFGGRVIKDKLFFFADTEALRYALGANTSVVAIPSPALQAYSLGVIRPSQVELYKRMFDLYNNAPGHERAVPVITGNSPLQDSSGRLGCGRLAGVRTATGAVFGTDVGCAEAWGITTPFQNSEWLLSTRVDYNVSGKQRIFWRFKTDHGRLPSNISAISPVFSGLSTQPDYNGQLNHTIVITPRLVNNVIASVIYNSYVFGFADLSAALKAFPVRVNFRDGGANGGRIASMGAAANLPGGRRDGQLQVVDDVSYMAGRHSLKAGFGFRYNRDSDLGESGYVSFGAFFFANLREFASGALNESWYQQRFTNTPVMHLRLYNLGLYVQDEWAVSAHLKITGTVRFQRTGNPYCSDHCFARLVRPFPMIDKGLSIPYNRSIETGLAHAFYRIEPVIPQPRVGLTYNPSWSRSTVLRGGVGVFSDLYPAFFSGIFGANAPNVFSPVIQTGLLAGGGAGSAPAIAAASAEAFQTQFARGATLDQLQQAVSPAPFGPPSYYSVPATLRSPKYIEWSFEIQRELGAKNVLTLRYAGNHGYDIFMTNEAVNAYASPDAFPNGFSGLPPAAPDPRFAVVNQLQNTGYSNYNGLTVWFRRAFGHGFQGQISYTWSHALDTLSNGGLSRFGYDSAVTQINPNNAGALNYSSADYDVRHNITGDFIWELPVKPGNRLLKAALGGWSVASRLNLHSGRPFSVFNYALSNELSGSFGGVVLADVVNPNIATTCGPSAVDRPCFSASEFVPAAAQGDLGNLPRNSFRGPGFFNIDSSVYKAFAIGDRMRLMLGASAYNVLNHVNFADPNNDVSQPGLGLITFTGTNPSGPYGNYGGPPARALVVTGRFYF